MEATYDSEKLLAHVGWVRALARSLVRDAAEADDLAQEALTAALEHGPRGEVAWRGWFRVVLRNLIAERSRAGGRRAARERVVAREEALPSELDSAARFSTHARVVAAVEALEEPFRTTVLLRYFDELPPRAIAAQLGVPVKTVNSRLVRAHAKLRERLEREHGGDRRSALLALVRFAGPEPSAAAPWKAFGLVAAALLAVAALGWRVAQRTTGTADALAVASEPTASDSGPAVASAQAADAQRSVVALGARQGDLEGRVLDSQGRPIADASIEVSERPAAGLVFASGAFASDERPVARTTTDEAGRWRVLAPRERALDVSVRAAGFARARHSDVFAGSSCETVLERPAKLTLVCRDERKRPLANARLELTVRDGWLPLVVDRTDANCRWSSNEVPPGVWSAQIVLADGSSPSSLRVAAKSGEEVERELVVLDGVRITGRVVAAVDRAPIANARIFVNQHHTVLTRSDAAGAFRLAHVAESTEWDLYVDADGFASTQMRVRAPDGAPGATPEPVEVALARGWTVRGRIEDVDGAPLADAWVIAYASGAGTLGEEPGVKTDASGAFELANLRTDLGHALYVAAPGRARDAWVLPVGRDGETLDVGALRASVGATLAGRVRDAGGRPVSGARVEFSREFVPEVLAVADRKATEVKAGGSTTTVSIGAARGSESATTLDPSGLAYAFVDVQRDGSFRAVDLAPGRWTVRYVPSDGGARQSREVELSAGERVEGLELRQPAGGAIAGRVVDPDGGALADATVLLYCTNASVESRVARTDADGAFRFDGLDDREYRVYADFHEDRGSLAAATGKKRAFVSRSVEGLHVGGPELELALGRTTPLVGRAVDERGVVLAGALVSAFDADDHQHQMLTDSHGRFEFAVAVDATLDFVAAWPGPTAQDASKKRLRAESKGVKPGADELVLTLR
ncbi:MAG: sigma-70 family RNA polymerase sigma factor [Planctomycetes bacterium]|nr:sigma-70 family RNA polymerase sigma factor [Planctomycetota bacterium]